MTDIEVYRKKANISRAEMSRIMEIPIRTIENWESGKASPPPYVERFVIKELIEISQNNNS